MSGEPARWVRKRFTPVIRRPAITLSNLILYGAPRPMKMGTIASPCHYDAGAYHTLESATLRRPAISHHASSAACRADMAGLSGYPRQLPCR